MSVAKACRIFTLLTWYPFNLIVVYTEQIHTPSLPRLSFPLSPSPISLLLLHTLPVPLLGYEVDVWVLLAIITFPIFVLKQCVYALQLVTACQVIGSLCAVRRGRRKSDTNQQ